LSLCLYSSSKRHTDKTPKDKAPNNATETKYRYTKKILGF